MDYIKRIGILVMATIVIVVVLSLPSVTPSWLKNTVILSQLFMVLFAVLPWEDA